MTSNAGMLAAPANQVTQGRLRGCYSSSFLMTMPESTSAKAILVVGPSWVGDMVMAQSLFKQLKENQPGCDIDVVAPGWSLPVLERMTEVRNGYTLDVKHGESGIGKRYRLGKQLRDNNYQQAIVLPRSFKSALLPFFARIPQRTGFRGEMRFGLLNDIRPFNPQELNQTVKKFTYLSIDNPSMRWRIHEPKLNVDSNNTRANISRLNLDISKFTVAILPGAEYGPAKQWPAYQFSNLIKLIDSAGAQSWIIGSGRDKDIAKEIIDLADGIGVNLCGETQLGDAIDLIAHADVAVSNDSGLMHVAAAVGTRVIAIYGSSSPQVSPPLSDNSTINWLELECAPCFQRICPLGHTNCLHQISADTIFRQLEPGISANLLNRT